MKTIAIIGASYLQRPLVVKAREMGLRTVCFMWEDKAVCRDLCDRFYPISIVEKDRILDVCRRERVDAVASIASDLAVPTVNYIAARMGLPANDERYTVITTNKQAMRQCFRETGVPSPLFTVSDAYGHCDTLGMAYPLIVKPTDRSGSQGVTRVDTPEALREAVERAHALSFERRAVVEEYIEGCEVSVETITGRGRHHILQITDKVTTGAPYFVETAHHQPSLLPADTQERLRHVTRQALDALHITLGASHTELRITPQGDIRVIEVGTRMGGDCIGSDLVRLSTGYDFVRGVIECALGEFREPQLTARRSAGIYFLSADTPQVAQYINRAADFPKIVRAEVTDKTLHHLTSSSDRSGYFIYQGDRRFEMTQDKLCHTII